MTKFEIAFELTNKNEGGYANNHSDHGGETWCGISRNNWPNWEGWFIIDGIKKSNGVGMIDILGKQSTGLQSHVKSFYKKSFWDQNRLDRFQDQQIANTVYDFSVNSGTIKAAKILQECLNLIQDGIIGKDTLMATNTSNYHLLHTAYNCKRETFYRSIAKGLQAKFLNSWLSRIKPYKNGTENAIFNQKSNLI